MPSDSLCVLTGFHIVAHIPFDALKQLVAEANRVLTPGGLLILETPNAENLLVGTQTFSLDPTHEKQIPQMLLEFLV
ncbi:SAM-dependent methyltransferase, partial [Pseudomonas graminis]